MAHDSIGNNTWEQTWRRVFVVDTLSNIGIDRGNKQMADGEGHPSPLIVGLTQLGVSGGQKLYFGDKQNYIRQIRKGILEFGAVKLVANTISLRKIIGDDVSIDNLSTQNIYAHTGNFDSLNKIDNLEFGEIKGDKIEADTATLRKINFGTLSGKEITTDQLHIENLLLNNLVANDIRSNYKIKAQVGDFITVSTNQIKTGTFNVDYLNVNNHLNVDSLSAKSIEANELHTNLSILGTLQAVSIICSNLQTINFEMPQEITLSKLNTNVISANGAVINNIAGTEIYGVNFKGTNLSSSTVRTGTIWSRTNNVSRINADQLSVLNTAKISTVSANQIVGDGAIIQSGYINYFGSYSAELESLRGTEAIITNGQFSTLYSATVSAEDFKCTNASIEKIIGTNISINKVIGNTVSFNSIIGANASFGMLKMDTVSANTVKGNTLSMGLVKSTTASSDKFKGTTVSAGLVKGTTASLGTFRGSTASMSNFKGGTASLNTFKGGTASTNTVKGLSIYATQWLRSANLSVSTKITANQLSTLSIAKIKTLSSNQIKGTNITTQFGNIGSFEANYATIGYGFSQYLYLLEADGYSATFEEGNFTTKIKSPMVSATNMKGTTASIGTVKGTTISMDKVKSANVSANTMKGVSLQGFDNVMVWF